ncbi:hypothetical protein [Burkholderia sp. LMG 32019]|uniref:hypothetical protein n=1 Tax=Burkholderia sp. LMG 32019 TaxID=3158173 RepID=UPI003C2AFE55
MTATISGRWATISSGRDTTGQSGRRTARSIGRPDDCNDPQPVGDDQQPAWHHRITGMPHGAQHRTTS